MTVLRCCDVETTGKEATDEVVEVAYWDVIDGRPLATRRLYVRPARPIPPSSSAIHHITDADVKDAQPWADAWRILVDNQHLPVVGEEVVFVAHMASFERQWLDPLVTPRWVDTWRCSLRQWPDLESHSLQSIRYELALPVEPDLAFPPHRAASDAYLCAVLVLELLKHQTLETLIAWSAEPAVFTKFDFGKFNGQPLSAADDGFCNWMLDKDFSEDWKWNIRRELQRRVDAKVEAAAAARRSYLDLSLVALAGAASVRDLENWYTGQADHWAKHGILIGTDDYRRLIDCCAERKRELLESGQPQFSPMETTS